MITVIDYSEYGAYLVAIQYDDIARHDGNTNSVSGILIFTFPNI